MCVAVFDHSYTHLSLRKTNRQARSAFYFFKGFWDLFTRCPLLYTVILVCLFVMATPADGITAYLRHLKERKNMGNEKRTWFLLGREKPDAEVEDTTPTLKYFFKLLWRKAAKLLTLNLMMVSQAAHLPQARCLAYSGSN